MAATTESCTAFVQELFATAPGQWAEFDLGTLNDQKALTAVLDKSNGPILNMLHNHMKSSAHQLLESFPDAKSLFPKPDWSDTNNAKLKRLQIADFFQNVSPHVDAGTLSGSSTAHVSPNDPPAPVMQKPNSPPAAARRATPSPPLRRTTRSSSAAANAEVAEIHSSPVGAMENPLASGPGGVQNSPVQVFAPPPRAPVEAEEAVVRTSMTTAPAAEVFGAVAEYVTSLMVRAPNPWNTLQAGAVVDAPQFESIIASASVGEINTFHDYLRENASDILSNHPKVRDSKVFTNWDWQARGNLKMKRLQITNFFAPCGEKVTKVPVGTPQRPQTAPLQQHGDVSPPHPPALGNEVPMMQQMQMQQPMMAHTNNNNDMGAVPQGPVPAYIAELLSSAPAPWCDTNVMDFMNPTTLSSIVEACNMTDMNTLHSYLSQHAGSVLDRHHSVKGAFPRCDWISRGQKRMKQVQVLDYFSQCGKFSPTGSMSPPQAQQTRRPATSAGAAPPAVGGGMGAQSGAVGNSPTQTPMRPSTSAGVCAPALNVSTQWTPNTRGRNLNGLPPVAAFLVELFGTAPAPWSTIPVDTIVNFDTLENAIESAPVGALNMLHGHLKTNASMLLESTHLAVRDLRVFTKGEWSSNANPRVKRMQVSDFIKPAKQALLQEQGGGMPQQPQLVGSPHARGMQRPQTAPATGRPQQQVEGGAVAGAGGSSGHPRAPPSPRSANGPVSNYLRDLMSAAPAPWTNIGAACFCDEATLDRILATSSGQETSDLHEFVRTCAWPCIQGHPGAAATGTFQEPLWAKGSIKMKRVQLKDFFHGCGQHYVNERQGVPQRAPMPQQQPPMPSANQHMPLPQNDNGGWSPVPAAKQSAPAPAPTMSGPPQSRAAIVDDIQLLEAAASRLRASMADPSAMQDANKMMTEISQLKAEVAALKRGGTMVALDADRLRRENAVLSGKAKPLCAMRCRMDGGAPSRPLTVNGPLCVIGRSSRCDVTLYHPRMSARHIVLAADSDNSGALVVRCLASNGCSVRPAVGGGDVPLRRGQSSRLAPGDGVVLVSSAPTRGNGPAEIVVEVMPTAADETRTGGSLLPTLHRALTCTKCTGPLIAPVSAGCGHSFCAGCAMVDPSTGLSGLGQCTTCGAGVSRVVSIAALTSVADAVVVHDALTEQLKLDTPEEASDGEATDCED